jgi:Tfp pilus assembly protein PilP
VSSYDIHEGTNTGKIMRMRDFKVSPIEVSEKVKDTNGVWDVSFKLEEF